MSEIPPEPPVGTWMKDRFGGVTMHHEGGGWAPAGCMPFGKWEAMWEARGPYVECGPWGVEPGPSKQSTAVHHDHVSLTEVLGVLQEIREASITSAEQEAVRRCERSLMVLPTYARCES